MTIKEQIMDSIQELILINRIMVRDEKTLKLEQWQSLKQKETKALNTINTLLESI